MIPPKEQPAGGAPARAPADRSTSSTSSSLSRWPASSTAPLFEQRTEEVATPSPAKQNPLPLLSGSFQSVPRTAATRQTSLDAHAQILQPARSIRERIVDFISWRGLHGATADEVSGELRLRTSTVTARINELVKGGRTRDSGHRRPTSSGRMAVVWVLAGTSCADAAAMEAIRHRDQQEADRGE